MVKLRLSQFDTARARLFATLVFLPALALFALYQFGFRQNVTQSLPPGIYRLTDLKSDPLVSFCPTGVASVVTSTRGYRPKTWGCPDHHAPMLKPIAARPGDVVTVTHHQLYVNGVPLPNTQSFPADNRGNPLFQFPEGTYKVAPGTLWVISTYNVYSYDSRYFGPIDEKIVAHHGHKVWTY